MKELKEKINSCIINLLLEVTGEDLDEITGGYCVGYGGLPAR